jgi:hypothetical protein
MAWNIEITAENMTSMAEHAIPQWDIEVQRLHTLVQKRHALGLRQLPYLGDALRCPNVAEPPSSAGNDAGYSETLAS